MGEFYMTQFLRNRARSLVRIKDVLGGSSSSFFAFSLLQSPSLISSWIFCFYSVANISKTALSDLSSHSCPCLSPCPCKWAGPITNFNQQNTAKWSVTLAMALHYIITSVLLQSLSLAGLDEVSCHVVRCLMKRPTQQGTEAQRQQ